MKIVKLQYLKHAILNSNYFEGDIGGFRALQHHKTVNEHHIAARKVNEHHHCKSVTRIFSVHLHIHVLLYMYLNNFPQNKHITMLLIAHMLILLMPVNQFSSSCEGKPCVKELKEAEKGKKRRGLYPRFLSSFTSLTVLSVTH